MSAIPGLVHAAAELPHLATCDNTYGAPWNIDWRGVYLVAPDEVHNHDKPAALGVLDGEEIVTGWNPWQGRSGPTPWRVIRHGYAAPGVQEFPQASPLAIDTFQREPTHAQQQLSGVSSIAALVPFMELPNGAPYHFDDGLQLDQGQAIGPRMIFREPPSFNDQTAALYAAGF